MTAQPWQHRLIRKNYVLNWATWQNRRRTGSQGNTLSWLAFGCIDIGFAFGDRSTSAAQAIALLRQRGIESYAHR
jgi:hypothetical protein